MMNKKIIIFIIVAILALIVGFIYIISTNKSVEQDVYFFDNVQTSSPCAEEGENIGSCVECITKCCNGLKGMARLKYENACVKIPALGSDLTCSNCGNAICDKQNNEDECNCPEDCK